MMAVREYISSSLSSEKGSQPRWDEWLSSSVSAAFDGVQAATSLSYKVAPGVPVYICAKAPKVAEADRQVARVRPYLNWLSSGQAADIDGEGINTSIGLLYLLAQSPAPVPIMSVGNDGKPSLYVTCGHFSAELSISGKQVEYFIRSGDSDVELFDEEEVIDGRVPPRLLGYLYSRFAQNSAE